ncbi:dTDP-glucose 4,6-dehydratase [Candidatus Uhrbacteria bacterium CG10_big_fil_rev_8_21_14_0_10_48_11]|uniref:dTDP-glucose 4,6-dehydratase n=1 Tax=Candidatus Uhrbacteria bacterium CG10_big_fil_rev_8_21_14_0_10_48_11 TaxID=1975037 RepID=A0A2M8LEG9_9BACT|nr:MAG: dTDP-glucose 4,6-dehydratase [Candidatus Uhrbacteria bacterium CG10_big_fil_rev_8_21_14_0_10_48_11]
MRILVAGGAGFIGSNFIHHLIETYPDYEVVNLDKLTYAGNLANLRDLAGNPRYSFIEGDIADEATVIKAVSDVDAVVNFAAETHVDRSIHVGSRDFVLANVLGVQTLLDAERKRGNIRHLQVSTDEVYGSLDLDDPSAFTEETPFAPNVPYAAAKAGGDLLCRSFFKTFGSDVLVTHCSNNYGPYQFPEKIVPFFIDRAMNDQPLPLYGDGKNVRDWLYVRDHCSALDTVLHKGKAGEVYNIGGNAEKPNIEIAKYILRILDKPESLITFVKDRPGHDRRYAIDATKLRTELGWQPSRKFEDGIAETISWYKNNQEWVNNIKAKAENINNHLG